MINISNPREWCGVAISNTPHQKSPRTLTLGHEFLQKANIYRACGRLAIQLVVMSTQTDFVLVLMTASYNANLWVDICSFFFIQT